MIFQLTLAFNSILSLEALVHPLYSAGRKPSINHSYHYHSKVTSIMIINHLSILALVEYISSLQLELVYKGVYFPLIIRPYQSFGSRKRKNSIYTFSILGRKWRKNIGLKISRHFILVKFFNHYLIPC